MKKPFIDYTKMLVTAVVVITVMFVAVGCALIGPQSGFFIDHAGKIVFYNQQVRRDSRFVDGFWCANSEREPKRTARFYNKSGQRVFKNDFDDARSFSNGLAPVCRDGKWGFINTKGSLVIKPRYDEVLSFCSQRAPVRVKDRWGIVDERGKWVVEPIFEQAAQFSEGLAAICVDGKIGYIDRLGEVVVKPKFDEGGSFSEGLARVVVLDNDSLKARVQFVGKDGNVVLDLDSVLSNMGQTSSSLLYSGPQRVLNCSYLFADKNTWAPANPLDRYGPIRFSTARFSNGLIPFFVNKKWGYLNKNGKLVISAKFTRANEFFEGLALVSIGEMDVSEQFGFIDDQGSFVIQPLYNVAKDFSDGLAKVSLGPTYRGWAFIDHSGKVVVKSHGQVGDFSMGLAPVQGPRALLF